MLRMGRSQRRRRRRKALLVQVLSASHNNSPRKLREHARRPSRPNRPGRQVCRARARRGTRRRVLQHRLLHRGTPTDLALAQQLLLIPPPLLHPPNASSRAAPARLSRRAPSAAKATLALAVPCPHFSLSRLHHLPSHSSYHQSTSPRHTPAGRTSSAGTLRRGSRPPRARGPAL
jgi:hypothetical protein